MDEQPNGSTVNPLPQDDDKPFSPAQPSDMQISTHPATDTNIDPQEVYEEGLTGAAEIEEPNAGSAVLNFDPMTERVDDPNKIDGEKPAE